MEEKNNKREKGTATGCTEMKMVKYGMECVDRGVGGKKNKEKETVRNHWNKKRKRRSSKEDQRLFQRGS